MITPEINETIEVVSLILTAITMSLIFIFPLIYVISGVLKRKDNYIWIAAAFAAPPIAALMYYLQKRRAIKQNRLI